MAVLLGILNFIFGAVAVFSTCVFILSCINSIINPTFPDTKSGVAETGIEKYDRFRMIMVIVMSISWGLVIAL